MKKAVKYIIIMSFFAMLWQWRLEAWGLSWFKPQPKTVKELQADLEKQQINDPTNPYVNYNLGVAAYKNSEYVAAEKNFALAVAHAKDQKLKEQCYFNAGNALYKAALAVLGVQWKTSKVEDAVLDKAIAFVSQAITRYESVLILKADHERALANKAICEELLRDLQEKKRWQHEKRPENNKDEQSSNKDKQSGDADNKQQKKDGGDKSDKASGDDASEQDSSDGASGDQRDKKDAKSSKQDKKSGKKEDSDTTLNEKNSAADAKQNDKGEKQEQADAAMNKEQQEKEEAAQAAAEEQGAKAAAEKEKEAQEERAIGESLRDGAEEQGEEAPASDVETPQDSATRKSYKVLLNRLDEQEAAKQKGRLQEKSKGSQVGASRNSQQKPW